MLCRRHYIDRLGIYRTKTLIYVHRRVYPKRPLTNAYDENEIVRNLEASDVVVVVVYSFLRPNMVRFGFSEMVTSPASV